MALLPAQVIRLVESMPADGRPGWWVASLQELRVAAAISDLGLDLDGWSDEVERQEFAALLEESADQLDAREPVTADEAAEAGKRISSGCVTLSGEDAARRRNRGSSATTRWAWRVRK